MTSRTQEVLAEAQRLSPVEQLELIRALSESLQVHYRQAADEPHPAEQDTIPASVKRAPPVTDLDELAADFWPEGESVDELNDYIQQMRLR